MNREGMTLVELLITVAICAILAASAMSVYSHCRVQATDRDMCEKIRQSYLTRLAADPEREMITGRNDYVSVTRKTVTYYGDIPEKNFTYWRTKPDSYYVTVNAMH